MTFLGILNDAYDIWIPYDVKYAVINQHFDRYSLCMLFSLLFDVWKNYFPYTGTKMQSQIALLHIYIFKKHAKNASLVSIFYAFSFFMENA